MVSEFRGIEGLTGQLDVNNILASWVDVRALNQVSGKLWKGRVRMVESNETHWVCQGVSFRRLAGVFHRGPRRSFSIKYHLNKHSTC